MDGDPRIRIIHETEQLETALNSLAPLLGSFRDKLTEAGFTRAEAVDLTRSLLLEMYKEAHRER